MNNKHFVSKPVKITQAIFGLNAAIWLIIGIGTLVRMSQTSTNQAIVLWVIAILIFGNAGAMLFSVWLIGQRKRLFYLAALAVLLVNIILTFTDQFGLLDFLTLIIDLILLGIMLVKRQAFWNQG
ncbi:MAG: hypothetical protein H6667_01425 [Ardenticatenaceae bacterium]|nr:hypothetical protein [Ardenticatenaceae bacterium]